MRFLALLKSSPCHNSLRIPRILHIVQDSSSHFFVRLLGADLLLNYGLTGSRALFGCQKRDQDVAFHARHGLDLARVADFTEQAGHLGASDFLVGHFAPAMENHRANFVTLSKKPDDLVLADLIIVLCRGRAKLDFLELRAAAALALLVRLLVLLVKIFAVVGDLANRRIRRRRDFHQIESAFARHPNRFVWLHHSKLATILINHTHFTRPNPLIDAGTVALPEIPFCDKSP
jgi:hypothetical protein